MSLKARISDDLKAAMRAADVARRDALRLLLAALKQREVHILIDLRKGKGEASVWTCDLSYEYIKINAAYRS